MMILEDITPGMKVVPVTKSIGGSLEDFLGTDKGAELKEKGYLEVDNVSVRYGSVNFYTEKGIKSFLPSDLVEYKERKSNVKFGRDDIKSGYVIETEGGNYMAIDVCGEIVLFNYNETLGKIGYYYDEDLSQLETSGGDLEIIRVWEPFSKTMVIDYYIDNPSESCRVVWENGVNLDVALMNVGIMDKDRIIKSILAEIKEHDVDAYDEYIKIIKLMN